MRGVSKRFGATIALANVDLTVAAGEVHALIGENGAGKSTLMKILAGALQPDSGNIALDGDAYSPASPLDGRLAGVAMIYQELSLAPHMTVAENILLGAEPMSGLFIRRAEMRRIATDAMQQVGRPDIPLDAAVGALSIAEQQLVEIARSVAVGCRVLVLDEPTSSLTQADIRGMFALVRRLRAAGCAIVYISHFLEEVREIADHFTVLRDGHTVGGGVTRETPVKDIIAMMVGRTVDELYPRSPRVAGEPMLRLDHLCGVDMPRDACLELRRGEVVGIAGIIGAGRTELMRAIFGLDIVRSGAIRVATYSGPARPAQRWAQGVGLVSEDRATEGLALGLSIADNLTLAKLTGLGPLNLVTHRGQERACEPWIRQVPITCASAHQPVRALSGGNQQKVALARLLHADVDLLLLDEPTRGIDVGSKAQIYQLIDDLAVGTFASNPAAASTRAPRAVLMVSSYLPELLGVCDRIAVMCRGRLGPARAVAQLDEHRIMLEATGADQATDQNDDPDAGANAEHAA
jgi:ribose transport system ATP-binding protein